MPYTRDHTFSDWLLTNEGTVEILNEDSNIEISCCFFASISKLVNMVKIFLVNINEKIIKRKSGSKYNF